MTIGTAGTALAVSLAMWSSRAIAAAWCAACAACIDLPASVEASGSGVSTGQQRQTVGCGGSATLDRYLAGGGGPVAITILDGAGRAIYDDHTAVNGEVNDSRQVGGTSGLWTLAVNPEGFAGQFKIALHCHSWLVNAAPPSEITAEPR